MSILLSLASICVKLVLSSDGGSKDMNGVAIKLNMDSVNPFISNKEAINIFKEKSEL